jgi:hypothetical protein
LTLPGPKPNSTIEIDGGSPMDFSRQSDSSKYLLSEMTGSGSAEG